MNKTDTVSEDEMNEIDELLRSFSYEGPVLRVQADKRINIDKAAEMIL
jgi:hypothetical protein